MIQIEKHAYFGYMISSFCVVGIMWLVSYFLVGVLWMFVIEKFFGFFFAAYLASTFKESVVV